MKYLKKFNESQEKIVSLKDLAGEHILSGVDISTELSDDEWGSNYESTVVRFILDGITYKTTEDPADGYRSYCSDIVICNDKVSNTFPGHKVIGKYDDGEQDISNNIIQFIDVATKDVVLEIGTTNSNDYYPSAIIHWNPENLELNRYINKYNL